MSEQPREPKFELVDRGTIRDVWDLPDWETPLVVSYGAGLDSWFVLTRLFESPDEPWASYRKRLVAIIHADLGAELPPTTAHLHNVAKVYLAEHGWEPTIILPRVRCRRGDIHTDFRSYLEHQAVIPSRSQRWCSDRFKIAPIEDAVKALIPVPVWRNVEALLGFDSAEGHRITRLSSKHAHGKVFPLYELGWDRLAMRRQLLEEGWAPETIPIKSRCSFCIFSKVAEIGEIDREFPEILEADIALEEAIVAANGRPDFTFMHAPLRTIRDRQRRLAEKVVA